MWVLFVGLAVAICEYCGLDVGRPEYGSPERLEGSLCGLNVCFERLSEIVVWPTLGPLGHGVQKTM